MSRVVNSPARIATVAGVVVLFVLISLVLARVFGAHGVERTAVVEAVKAEAQRLDKPGSVKVLNIDPSTRFALGGGTATARVAWKAGSALPVVQCVRLRRTGDVISGFEVTVERVSAPIGLESAC